jgi:hypothetical protein
LTAKPQIRLTSTRCCRFRWQHNQGGNPLKKRPEPVQTNRATSPADTAALANSITNLSNSVANTGNGFQFGGLSALGLSINRVFKQPVAIAWDGILFDVTTPDQEAALRAMCDGVGGPLGNGTGFGTSTGAGTTGGSGPSR